MEIVSQRYTLNDYFVTIRLKVNYILESESYFGSTQTNSLHTNFLFDLCPVDTKKKVPGFTFSSNLILIQPTALLNMS